MPVELEDWATRLAAALRDVHLRRELEEEADRLAAVAARHAPRRTGALARSFRGRGLHVEAAPYAEIVSEGGTVRSARIGGLLVPVRPGYRPGPGFATVRSRGGQRIVVRSGTHELWAIRRREVRLRGDHFLARALESHLDHADERVARALPGVAEEP